GARSPPPHPLQRVLCRNVPRLLLRFDPHSILFHLERIRYHGFLILLHLQHYPRHSRHISMLRGNTFNRRSVLRLKSSKPLRPPSVQRNTKILSLKCPTLPTKTRKNWKK